MDGQKEFMVGDSVREPIWDNDFYKWKIESLFIYKGRLRAALIAVIKKFEPKYDCWGKRENPDMVAKCSCWVQDLKLASDGR